MKAKDQPTGIITHNNLTGGSAKGISTRFLLFFTATIVMAFGHVMTAELWVDQKAAAGGDGSTQRPFQTINEAIKAAKDSDSVTVKAGVYREHVTITKKGAAGKPFSLRAAAGEEVVVSGFKPITGWQKFRDNIYTTTVDWPARDLYVAYMPQMISRYPDTAQAWRVIDGIEGNNLTVRADETLPPLPPKITNKDLFLFSVSPDTFCDFYLKVTEYDPEAKVLKLDMGDKLTQAAFKFGAKKTCVGSRFLICNDVSLVTQPGKWAYESLEGNKTRLYFWPKAPGDLQKMQSRPGIGQSITDSGPMLNVKESSYVRVEGLEVTGGGDGSPGYGGGIAVHGSQHVTIESCIAHNNGGNSGIGITTLRTTDVTIRRCMAIRNYFGILINQSHSNTVEQCEAGYSLNDASRITASIPKWPTNKDKPPLPEDFSTSDNDTFRQCYFHNSQYMGHPDGCQSWAFRNGRIEDNLIMYASHGIIIGNFHDAVVTGNVIIGGASAGMCIDGGKPGKEEKMLVFAGRHNTIALSGLFSLQYESGNIIFDDNLVYGHPLEGPASRGNAYHEWEAHGNLVWDFAAKASVLDPKAVVADPLPKNMPQASGFIVDKTRLPSTASHLYLVPATPKEVDKGFAVGDNVEVNGDGVARHVTAADKNSITIDPPLPSTGAHVIGDIIVFNWGKRTNFQMDTRPDPNGAAGKLLDEKGAYVGSTLDVAAYQRGEFEGNGKRLLPPVPAELKAAWPDPSCSIIPAWGMPSAQGAD